MRAEDTIFFFFDFFLFELIFLLCFCFGLILMGDVIYKFLFQSTLKVAIIILCKSHGLE